MRATFPVLVIVKVLTMSGSLSVYVPKATVPPSTTGVADSVIVKAVTGCATAN